jgi:hypothetical protein
MDCLETKAIYNFFSADFLKIKDKIIDPASNAIIIPSETPVGI